MICKTLQHIWLLDELQYWIDSWTPFNAAKRHTNFCRLQIQLWNNGDYESESVAAKARELSVILPF